MTFFSLSFSFLLRLACSVNCPGILFHIFVTTTSNSFLRSCCYYCWKHHYSLKSSIKVKMIIKSWWCSNLYNFNQNILQSLSTYLSSAAYLPRLKALRTYNIIYIVYPSDVLGFAKTIRVLDFNFKENFSILQKVKRNS